MMELIKRTYRKAEAKSNLMRVFKLSKIYRTHRYNGNEIVTYPLIHEVAIKENFIRFTFTLPDGVNPKIVEENEYTFQQVFGRNIEIDGDIKKFVVKVYRNGLPKKFAFTTMNGKTKWMK